MNPRFLPPALWVPQIPSLPLQLLWSNHKPHSLVPWRCVLSALLGWWPKWSSFLLADSQGNWNQTQSCYEINVLKTSMYLRVEPGLLLFDNLFNSFGSIVNRQLCILWWLQYTLIKGTLCWELKITLPFFFLSAEKKKNGLPFSAEERGIHISRNQAVSLLGKANSGNNENSSPNVMLSLIVKCMGFVGDLDLVESIPWVSDLQNSFWP